MMRRPFLFLSASVLFTLACSAGVAGAAPPPVAGASFLSAANHRTCVVTASGGVQCWGYNGAGQLGDGTAINRSTPVDVVGWTSGIATVGIGNDHMCALTAGGGVECRGYNGNGQLGDGTQTSRETPVDVVGLAEGVTAIAVGGWHTCAVTAAGGVKCWGANAYGQLGDGTTIDRATPADVLGVTGAVAVAAGAYHTCALTGTGGVKCWGRNQGGQLGDGTTNDRPGPIDVSGLASGNTSVTAGWNHTCAVTAAGGVKCWGDNGAGTLGDGTRTAHWTPVDVIGIAGARGVSASTEHTCAVMTTGAVKCWGGNLYGQLGDGTAISRLTAVDVQNLAHAASTVATAIDHSCALSTDGAVQCWGSDAFGELGIGASSTVSTPIDVPGLAPGVLQLTAGYMHTCAVTLGGAARCWGSNGNGQLGDDTLISRASPAAVASLDRGVTKAAAGSSAVHACALTSAGGVKCWGGNGYGQLGDGTTSGRLVPVDVAGLSSGIAALALGISHTCALTVTGSVKCWGANSSGQLGDGTTTDRLTPVDVSGLASGVVAIAAGARHTCALTSAGGVKCWGSNESGQIGDATTNARVAPVDVSGLSSGVTAITAGSGHTCALTSGGGVRCWGQNTENELGDGTQLSRLSPVDVASLTSGVAAVSAGYQHTCALTVTGGVKCWGWNSYGQLGNEATTGQAAVPVDTAGLTTGVAAIAAGGYHTCALTTGGAVQCWGDDESGQVGDGRDVVRAWPSNVIGFGAIVTLTNRRASYDGTPKPITVATTPSGLAVAVTYTGTGATTYGPSGSAPSAIGTYAVSAVVTDAGSSGSATATLTIANAAPAITQVYPSSGPDFGGTRIMITGTGFMPSATVEIAGVTVTSTYVNATTIMADTPPFAGEGIATVVVRNPSPSFGEGAAPFVYLPYPQILTVSPTVGPIGSAVTFEGKNFDATDAAISFAGLPAVVTSRSATEIVATVPAGVPSGPVDVVVTNVALGRGRGYSRLFTVSGEPATAGSVAAGNQATCVVTASGGVRCWGDNRYGQLGDGTVISRGTPADVTGLTSGVSAVVIGAAHACALTTGGAVKCWGENWYGEIGDGTTINRPSPVDVHGLSTGVAAIAAVGHATCALTTDGTVRCWGQNDHGQLGDGSGLNQPEPVGVAGLTAGSAVALAAGAPGTAHMCAITTAGGLKCWGQNSEGELGDGTTFERHTPADVPGLSGVSAVAVGSGFTCALTTAGAVKCWGANYIGQLGDGTWQQSSVPVDVTGLGSGVTRLSAGDSHACVLVGGAVNCWGQNASGEIGNGTRNASPTPANVSGLAHTVTAVAAGSNHTCALGSDGTVQCWGADAFGQLGAGRNPMLLTPARLEAFPGTASAIATGASHTCAVTTAGGLKCWGDNFTGQLGDGTVTPRATPEGVRGLSSGITAAAGGFRHSCAVTASGGVKCWGYNAYGQLGDATIETRLTAVDVKSLTSGVSAVGTGDGHSCALTADGGVKCWGANSYGQLGDGTTTDRQAPTDVTGLTSGVTAISVGPFHTCAVTSGGGVKCWGYNAAGRLGDGTTADRSAPVDVVGVTGAVQVAAGNGHTCALTSGGGVKCWGDNLLGQIGDGTTANGRLTAVDVSGLTSGVAAVAAGLYHTCVVTSDRGAVKCWGDNRFGQLGDGTLEPRRAPIDPVDLAGGGIAAVAAGGFHTCALATSGDVFCWGFNESGQLGDGGNVLSEWPTNASGFGASVRIGGLNRIYDGAPKAVEVFTTPTPLPVALTYTGVDATTYGPSASAPSAAGTYSVFATVIEPGYTGSGSSTALLTIANPTPVIATIAPSAGPDFGGTLITITGSGFMTGSTVVVGGTPVPGNVVNSTTMTAVTPIGLEGVATVTVRNPQPTFDDATAPFTYLAYPQVVSILPNFGPAGTSVTIDGVNFGTGDVAVTFGGQAATVTSHSATQMVLTVPAGLPPSRVDLTVTNVALGRSRTYPGLFTVTPQVAGAGTIAAGDRFACALTPSGGVRCWGNNRFGQLGDGTYVYRGTPADVTGLTSGVIAVTGGTSHACALTSAGGVKCWGLNGNRQLGDGTSEMRATPVDVVGLAEGVSAIAAGAWHTCALMANGTVKCWGSNFAGQLGDGTYVYHGTPADVTGLTGGAIAIAAGYNHSCAVTVAGVVKCWGQNSSGQLGDGTTTQRPSPVDVAARSGDAIAIAASGNHTCTLTNGGVVQCWGENWSGQLGDGTSEQRPFAGNVIGLPSGVVSIGAGNQHTCAVTNAGAVQCWGGNSRGQLGDGTFVTRATPGPVVGLAHAVSFVALGSDHTCAVETDGGVQCWGSDGYGQLGVGTNVPSVAPADVVGLTSGVVALDAGDIHNCVVTATGGVKCWGENTLGALGDGTTRTRARAAGVIGLAGGVARVALGNQFSCALTTAGGVKCWGVDYWGQVGDGAGVTSALVPVDVAGLASGVSAIAAGWGHACALTTAGGVKCWGLNGAGQVGDGTTSQRWEPVDVSGLTSGVGAILAGFQHTCVLMAAGSVKCWGSNDAGQLGDGTTINRSVPTDVPGLTSVVALSGGRSHTCALTSAGGVVCWGGNNQHQLGDGTITNRPTPGNVSGLTSGVVGIASGSDHTCAVMAVGGVKCWGSNYAGQLGDGTRTGRDGPIDVNVGTAVSTVTGGLNHTCALTTAGGVRCWGDDDYGQLGDARQVNASTPANVLGFGATIGFSNLDQVFDGSPKPVTVTTTPPGLAVDLTYAGIDSTTYGPSASAPSAAGTYSVFATVNDSGYTGSGSATALLTIANPTPGITTITPPAGPDFGGTLITITGNGFMPGAIVLVGGTPVAANFVNSTTITAVTPIGVAGVATVTIRNPEPTVENATTVFTYLAYPQAASILPNFGPAGTSVTIDGTNFDAADVAVTFGGQPATVTSRSATRVVATVPTGLAPGGVDVTVTNVALGRSRTYLDLFTVTTQVIGAGTVAAGNSFACALTPSGGVRCWGSNRYGELGDGTYVSRGTPADVSGLTSGVVGIAAGTAHACAVTSGGGVKCWGSNNAGQLGDGTLETRTTPVDVTGLTAGVTALTAGGGHTCALRANGTVTCWGTNFNGQLGDGTTTGTGPVDVINLAAGAIAVSAGMDHTCAVTRAGGVKCWGSNSAGKLGDGTTTRRPSPVDVAGLASGVTAVAAASSHTCALTSAGVVKCWGGNWSGQLGDGTRNSRSIPGDVVGLATGVVTIASGSASTHTCAVTDAGAVQCWGSNWRGQLGDGTNATSMAPVSVVNLSHPVTFLATGGDHTCALETDGALQCWGGDGFGQIGRGTNVPSVAPADVVGLTSGVVALGVGDGHNCVITTGGAMRCWGSNGFGTLGDGTTRERATVAGVNGLATGVARMALSSVLSCALTTAGGVKCWGNNYYGQVGNGTTAESVLLPVDVVGLTSGVAGIAAGNNHACALTTAGGVKCWGLNAVGQLGDGTTTTQRLQPVDVAGLANGVTAIMASGDHTCALTTAGGVKCWGRNDNGQLGDGTTTNRNVPTDVPGLNSVVALSGGMLHACALTAAGGVLCWGANSSGQLGDGTSIRRSTPGDVIGLTSGVFALGSGSNHTCAVMAGGALKCWGANSSGQLGNGARTPSYTTPIDVGLGTAVVAVGGGTNYTCVLTTGGGVKCWGDDDVGQLGDGREVSTTTPTTVLGFGVTIRFSNLNQVYDGTAKAVTTVTTPAGQTVTITYAGQDGTVYGPTTTAPIEGGMYSVRGVVTGASSGTAGATLTIRNPAASIASISPASGPDFGGTPITINGSGFRPGAALLVNGVSVAATWVSSSQMTAYTPAATPGVATVVVLNPSPALDAVTPGTFTYVANYPQVVSLLPTSGVAGTSVTITGSGFSASDAAVWFGGRPAVVTSRSSTEIIVTVPFGLPPGAVDVTVSSVALGLSWTAPHAFTIEPSSPAAITAVSVGYSFTCAVRGGGATCWGDNSNGQLGDGTTLVRSTPGDVLGLTSGVAAVAAGNTHACALTTGGGVKCWGANPYGQLGDGSPIDRSVPGDVVGLGSGVSAIAAGGDHTCALTTGGGVKCWGRNNTGQLGDGTRTGRLTPVDVVGLSAGVTAIVAGNGSTCAIVNGGGVKCWGLNGSGQLGDGTPVAYRVAPVDVIGLASAAVALSAGGVHVCALTADGSVQCWGSNAYGELGAAPFTRSSTPITLTGVPDPVSRIAAEYGQTCALTVAGAVYCWGMNASGQLGDGTLDQRFTPGAVLGLTSGVTALSEGPTAYHRCAVSGGSVLECWGSNSGGQLGDGSQIVRTTPFDVTRLATSVERVAAGGWSTCVVTSGGAVKCFGHSPLGNGTGVSTGTPVDVTGLSSGASRLAASTSHACAVSAGGAVKCWGNNVYGQLGDGTKTWAPAPVAAVGLASGVTDVATGMFHSCAITSAGGVKCWGVNDAGQLGDGTSVETQATPVDVVGLSSGVVALAAGEAHTCALTSAGAVKCWGWNSYGQLGDGTTTDRATPTDVSGLASGVVAIAAAYDHTCALMATGVVKCWGYNDVGQLGDGTTTPHSAPADVTGLGGVVAIATGMYDTCAVTAAGTVKCWGSNPYGILGDGPTAGRTTPGDIVGITGGALSISVGIHHACAVMTGGGLKCWGLDSSGQLGDGKMAFSPVPLEVPFTGKTRAPVSLDNLVQTYDGAPKSVTVTTVPAGLAANVLYAAGVYGTSYGASTTPPSAPGLYVVSVKVTDAAYYGAASGLLTINNVVPVVTTLSPSSRPAGSGQFELTVNGTGFVTGAQVLWNGGPRATTFVSATELRATILAADIATAGAASVTVANGAPALGTSGPLTFTIRAGGGVIPGDVNGDGTSEIVIYRAKTGEWWVRGATGAAPVFGAPNDLPAVADYNGDGQADIAVWRPATGAWFIKDQPTVVLGAAGDIPVPGDYNGDGKAEAAVFDPRAGVWQIAGQASVMLGQPGDVPVPGDYNGDGTMEPAVFRRATGTWTFADHTTIGWGGPGDIPVPADYNGDGTTDVAIYRPSTGDWYVRNGVHIAWGAPGDVPVPLDVDGDGRAEIIVYRPATGAWFIYHTESAVTETVMWGGAGDVPIGQQPRRSQLGANDLDGDGRSDVTVFRPGTGQWFTLGSASGFTQWSGTVLGENGDIPLVGEFMGTRLQQRVAYRPSTGVWRLEDGREIGWGSAGDIPVLGDYDGDGVTDIAVYRPTTGAWYVLTSLSGYTESKVFGWGGEGDAPVPGDYDGDGITDVAVYRPSTGTWFVLTSSSAYQQYQIYAWGTAEDVPVVGDYDGDGISDIAVYRASIGAWYIVTSSSNFMGTLSAAWGGGEDIPVPGDYNGDGFTDVAVYRPSTGTWFVMGSTPIEWGAAGDVPVKR